MQLIGNVGQEPTLREFDNGGCVCNLTIATTERGFTTKDGRKIDEKTEWHNVVFKNALAKVIQKYVRKGDKIYIEGKLTTRTYLKDDEKRFVTEIVANDFAVARGMGSSSAALACGIIAGNKMAGNKLSNAERDRLAVKLEGHPDNIIPCLYGDLVTTVVNDNELIIEKLEVRSDLSFILFIPKYKVKTIEARNALPSLL